MNGDAEPLETAPGRFRSASGAFGRPPRILDRQRQ
jgi:hypothetical protein